MKTLQDKTSTQVLYVISGTLFVLIICLVVYVTIVDNRDENASTGTNTESVGQIINQTLTDFSLTANDNNEISLSQLQGNHVLLAFGYTHCPDVCPATLLKFKRVKSLLGEDADQLQFVFISVDGERDTPEVLDRYMRRYDESFIGLSGHDDVLSQIQDEYGLFYERRENPNSRAGYLVDHTASKFLINPEGELIRIYSFAVTANEIASEIRQLL